MKKSTIWILTIVMALTFVALLYFQLMYMERMVKMRNEQFSESVMRSLYATCNYLEKEETMHYLQQDVSKIEATLYSDHGYDEADGGSFHYSVEGPDGSITNYTLSSAVDDSHRDPSKMFAPPVPSVASRFQTIHDVLRGHYLYQKGLLNEVILTILREAGSRSVEERADSTTIRNYLGDALRDNGVTIPFTFAVATKDNHIIYQTQGFNSVDSDEVYRQTLFPNSDTSYQLLVGFPTKDKYIHSTVRFVIPTFSLTLILLVVFLYTIILAFRQKKLTEMKADFINNMTHELKTPISTISLAAQMLGDSSIGKSPESLKHLSGVIIDESKRLRFQVEKVLQMSVFDRSSSSALKFTDVDANSVIANVVNTFKIKVEKYGGQLQCALDAEDSRIYVDEMQFTNVIFNLLDNAVKYSREDVPPELAISTCDTGNDMLEIRVSDNGIGIRKEDIKRIFDKFYRVSTGNRHDVKGFGLGLAYVKKMVDLFHGSITVESELGKGTTFVILLPLISTAKSEKNIN